MLEYLAFCKTDCNDRIDRLAHQKVFCRFPLIQDCTILFLSCKEEMNLEIEAYCQQLSARFYKPQYQIQKVLLPFFLLNTLFKVIHSQEPPECVSLGFDQQVVCR